MTNQTIAKFCILTAGILALPTLSFAGKEIVSKDKNPVEIVKESCITGDIGVNVVSQYISRGLIFENQGGIIEPYADLYFRIYKGDGFINKVSVNLGTWDSFHSRHTDAGEAVGRGTGGRDASSTRSWYESDFTAGIAVTFLKNFTITPSYYTFLSPNDGFNTFQGLNVNLAYDDTDLLGKFALHPHATVLFEFDNKAGNGTDEGIYYEVGIAPALPIGETGLTFTLPITAGFGSNEFYAHNAGFGYFSTGVQASYALAFVPKCLGAWTVNGGATYYYLGSNSLRSFNAEPANDVRDSKNSEWVFSGGLAVSF